MVRMFIEVTSAGTGLKIAINIAAILSVVPEPDGTCRIKLRDIPDSGGQSVTESYNEITRRLAI